MAKRKDNQDYNQPEMPSPISDLEKKLYSREQPVGAEPEREFKLSPHYDRVQPDWGEVHNRETSDLPVMKAKNTRMTFLKKMLLASIGFFLLAVVIAVFAFFGGANSISSDKVGIAIAGPLSIGGGEILSLQITVENQNNADMESADLVIDFPSGTRQVGDLNTELKRSRDALGPIASHQAVVKKSDAVLFGEEGEQKEILVRVEYRVKGSSATFHKEKAYDLIISSAPVIVAIDSMGEVSSNQSLEFTLNINSNSNTTIQNLLLRADYPFGFTFESSTLSPSAGDNIWNLGDLKPEAKRSFKIRGKLSGLDGDERTFRFTVGTVSPQDPRAIGTAFLTSARTVGIKRPFIGLDLAFDGELSQDFVTRAGRTVRADLTWVNNLGGQLLDASLAVRIQGQIFDRSSVFAGQGFFRSVDNTLIWDQSRDPLLSAIGAGDNGRESFTFTIFPNSQIGGLKNRQMTLDVTMTGKRLNERGDSEIVSSTISKTVKLATDLTLSSRLLYFSGPFTNTGPIPPKVETETTYTAVLTLSNNANDVENAKVVTTLPAYVKWLGVSSPASEKISYNPVGGEVVWEVGSIKSGTGFGTGPREVAFQIGFLPSLSQVGGIPTLVGEISASGDDTFVNSTIRSNTKSAMTTELSSDPNFESGGGVVVGK